MQKFLLSILSVALIPFAVWAVDSRISQQMGSVVQEQMYTERVDYLEFIKRSRVLTPQEQRDLDYYRSKLRRAKGE